MGLQNQLTDLSSDSIPVLFIALIAHCIGTLRSFLLSLFHSVGLNRFDPDEIDAGLSGRHLGSGLAGLIILAEQLNLNSSCSYRYTCSGAGGGGGKDCMVCLCTLRDEDEVRKLDCRHVFHKECFDGWLKHLNFNCPLCRSPLVPEERVCRTRRRVGRDLVEWFSLQY